MGNAPTRWLLLAGLVGPSLFVALALAEGASRSGYDPVRQYVSLLSLGDGGWLQQVNFVVSGLLIAAFGGGLMRVWVGATWAPRLVVVAGVGLIVSGLFVTDPAQGYPAGAPLGLPATASWHAGLHYLGALLVFLGLPAAIAIAARRAPGKRARVWAPYSFASAIVMVGAWLATFAVPDADAGLAVAGRLQRVAIIAGFQWLVATALIELGRLDRATSPVYG